MPKKPTKWRIELFALCNSAAYYNWNVGIYTGQAVQVQQEYGFTWAVFLNLTSELHHQRYVCFTDNYYISPTLANELAQWGIELVGTCSADRQGWPQIMKDTRVLERNSET